MPTIKSNKNPNEVVKKSGWELVEEKASKFLKNKFRDKGFDVVTKPETPMPSTRVNIGGLSLVELSDLTSRYSQWREYSEDLHTASLTAFTMLSEEFDFEYAKAKMRATGKPTDKILAADADPVIRELRQKLLEAELYRDMLGEKIESFTNCLSVLSREVTLRREHS